MSPEEFERVTSGIFTDHPTLKPGESSHYFYGKYFYRFTVNGPGDYHFNTRLPIVGNETKINRMLKGGK